MNAASPLIDPAPRTFFGVPSRPDLDLLDAQVAFLGVPYDGGTPQPGIPTGQRSGPAAAREATEAQRAIAERGALMVAIGGDHSISYPLGRGFEPLGEFDVVHVDAHTDFLDDLGGARLTGASQLRRLAELPFVGTVTALGVRNVDRAEVDGLRELGGRWATSLDLIDRGACDVVQDTVADARPLYVSIDLDVLDSSVAPGHSLQEPGGLDCEIFDQPEGWPSP